MGTAAEMVAAFTGQFIDSRQLGGPAFLEPLAPFSLPTEGSGLPEEFALQVRWQVLLGDPVVGIGVGIAVAESVTEGFAVPMGIPQVGGDPLFVGSPHGLKGREDPHGAVAFLSPRQVKRRLGQGIQTFGQAHPIEATGAGSHHHHRLGISQAHILTGGDQHAPQQKTGIFAGLHHPGQPEQGGIGI